MTHAGSDYLSIVQRRADGCGYLITDPPPWGAVDLDDVSRLHDAEIF